MRVRLIFDQVEKPSLWSAFSVQTIAHAVQNTVDSINMNQDRLREIYWLPAFNRKYKFPSNQFQPSVSALYISPFRLHVDFSVAFPNLRNDSLFQFQLREQKLFESLWLIWSETAWKKCSAPPHNLHSNTNATSNMIRFSQVCARVQCKSSFHLDVEFFEAFLSMCNDSLSILTSRFITLLSWSLLPFTKVQKNLPKWIWPSGHPRRCVLMRVEGEYSLH